MGAGDWKDHLKIDIGHSSETVVFSYQSTRCQKPVDTIFIFTIMRTSNLIYQRDLLNIRPDGWINWLISLRMSRMDIGMDGWSE
jgi:hypothetical protein